MFKLIKSNSILVRNCLIAYLITGFLAHIFAESHRSFQTSIQSSNAYTFSRVISIGFAHHAKDNFSND